MKKVLSLILVAALLISSLLVLTGCENKENSSNANDLSAFYSSAEKGVLKDKWNGLQVLFSYPNGYTLTQTDKSAEYQKVTLIDKEKNAKIELKFSQELENTVTTRKTNYDKAPEKYSNFSEIEYAGYKGCVVQLEDSSYGPQITGILLLKESGKKSQDKKYWYALSFTIQRSSSSNSAEKFDAPGFYNSVEGQGLLKSIEFTDEFDGKISFDGIIANNHEWGIKTIKSTDESKYKVQQYTNSSFIVTWYETEEKDNGYDPGAQISIYNKKKGTTLEKAMQDDTVFKKGEIEYKELTYGGIVFHDLDRGPLSTRSADYHQGYFEKDGYVWFYDFSRSKGADEALEKQVIEDALANMTIINEN